MSKDKRLIGVSPIIDEQKAFRDFFNHYYPRLLRFALFILKSDVLAEEVVSDVFVKVWKNWKRILDIDNLDSYMFTSVRNQSLSYLKMRNLELLPLNQSVESSLINKTHPESELLDKELIIKVEEAIQKLPPKCQMIFRLSRDEGFKYDEVAQILNISKSTVKNQMAIALKKIKIELSSYFGVEGNKNYKFLISLFLAL